MQNQSAPDIAKAIGIFLVVLGHTLRGLMNAGVIEATAAWSMVDKLIYLFHMPLFFFLSGLFFEQSLKRRTYSGLLKNNMYILLLPLIAWSYIQYSIQYLASGSTNIKLTLHDVLLAPFPPSQQFWFLWTLFVVAALSGAVMQLKYPRVVLGAAGLICVGLNLAGFGDISSSMPGATMIRFAPYFILGALGGPNTGSTVRAGNTVAFLILVIALFIYSWLGADFESVRLLTSFACIFSIYKISLNFAHQAFLARQYSVSSFLVFIGMNSMIIYLTHVIFAAAFRAALLKMGIIDVTTHVVCGVLAGVMLPLALIPISLRAAKISPLFVGSIFPARIHRNVATSGDKRAS